MPTLTNVSPSGDERSRDEVLMLPARERIRYAERVLIFYPRWEQILDTIEACHERRPGISGPYKMLVGLSGTGKTTLLEYFAQRYPPQYTEIGRVIPVLRLSVPAKATINTCETALLSALGDPRAGRGTVGDKMLRLPRFLEDCQVQTIILDEVQHLIDPTSQRVLLSVSDWFKWVLKESSVACILSGLAGVAEAVLQSSGQLTRLFRDPLRLDPFAWKWDQPETIEEFRTLLDEIEAHLPLREPSHLQNMDTAWRCWVASTGIMDYLKSLLVNATARALGSGQERINVDVLAEAFRDVGATELRAIKNPFIGEAPARNWKPKPGPLPPGMTRGRRPRRQKGQEETLDDLLS